MVNKCIFCNREFKNLSIKQYDNWDLQLFRDDQYYIGRSVAVFQNQHIEDICDLTKKERDELFDTVIPELQISLETIFDPDMYNYSSIGNDCPHLHLHIIPRYKHEREFGGEKFTDEYWNQTYSQDYNPIKLEESKLNKLIDIIRNNIHSSQH